MVTPEKVAMPERVVPQGEKINRFLPETLTIRDINGVKILEGSVEDSMGRKIQIRIGRGEDDSTNMYVKKWTNKGVLAWEYFAHLDKDDHIRIFDARSGCPEIKRSAVETDIGSLKETSEYKNLTVQDQEAFEQALSKIELQKLLAPDALPRLLVDFDKRE